MTRNQQVAVLFSALLLLEAAPAPAHAVEVTVPLSGPVTIPLITAPGSVLVNFPAVANAFRLNGIDGMSITGPEGGTVNLAVHYVGGGTSYTFLAPVIIAASVTNNLSSVLNVSFSLGDVDQIQFTTPLSQPPSLSIGEIADFRFEVQEAPTGIPEPFTAALLGTGLLGLAWVRRRAGKD